jgi:C-methyltransferase C-terminal domain/Putative zinc binding domain/Methyltransferase domain
VSAKQEPVAAHDLPTGPLKSCQICSSSDLAPVLDLGHQPPCDSLLTPAQLRDTERTYPLRFLRCRACGLTQIDYVVPPEVVFHPEYPYRSGITTTLVKHLQGTAGAIVDNYKIPVGELAVDIGSNDGTLLKGFKARSMRVLGVEATNIAQIANVDGIETIQAFFNEGLARSIVANHGQAAAITATNMFAHVARLGELMRGVVCLLKDGGVFVTESHYLPNILETAQYDSIYHEHLKSYSLRPLMRLLSYYGFTVTDAEKIPNYGGSIRVYAIKGKGIESSERLRGLLDEENRIGLNSDAPYDRFRQTVLKSKRDLIRLLVDLAAQGKAAPGIGCPGRSSTLLNFVGVTPDLMPYIAEQSTSLKIGLFLPGRHIPIVDEARLFEEQPDHAVMLSWHYAEPIIAGLRRRGLKSKIIMPLPEVRIVE